VGVIIGGRPVGIMPKSWGSGSAILFVVCCLGGKGMRRSFRPSVC
jgi:hypothetical protein